jgi:Fic family protein
MSVYEQTHPWITFTINLSTAPAKLWVYLGECKSICENLSGIPLLPYFQNEMMKKYLAKGIYCAVASDGNTLSVDEIYSLLFSNLSLSPSKKYLGQEVINIRDGYQYIDENVLPDSQSILSVESIKELNRIVLDRLVLDSGTEPGHFRTNDFSIPTHRFSIAPASDCEYLTEQLCSWLNSKTFEAPQGLKVVYGILKAIVANLYLTWIHPFGKGNSRTTHLVEVLLLIESGLPAITVSHFNTLYFDTKYDYFRHIESASSSKGKILPFIIYSVQGFLDELKEQKNFIDRHLEDVVWNSLINLIFNEKTSIADIRRKYLALDLSSVTESVQLSKIPEITTRMAKYYSIKTTKTLSRDLADLERLGLVKKTPEGYQTMKDIVKSFFIKKV